MPPLIYGVVVVVATAGVGQIEAIGITIFVKDINCATCPEMQFNVAVFTAL
jgi:hypothetical protein